MPFTFRYYTHPFNGPFPGLPRWASTRKVKPIWILLKQETVSGSGISWVICQSAPRSRQITTPAPHHSVFTGRMAFLPPNQQRQSYYWKCKFVFSQLPLLTEYTWWTRKVMVVRNGMHLNMGDKWTFNSYSWVATSLRLTHSTVCDDSKLNRLAFIDFG